tara:strand:+ start:242 stop:727 length:486 start_codon:yes stop_codon:yes gene_type:complete
MSKEFCDYINNLNYNFIITRQDTKKHKFSLKQGIINFKIDLKNGICPICPKINICSLKKCAHLYKIFEEVYNVPFEKLQYLWTNDNYKKVLNKEEMIILDNDIECPICLEDAGKIGYDRHKVIHCLDCGKFAHSKCLIKSNRGIKCLICTSNWLPDWLNGK